MIIRNINHFWIRSLIINKFSDFRYVTKKNELNILHGVFFYLTLKWTGRLWPFEIKVYSFFIFNTLTDLKKNSKPPKFEKFIKYIEMLPFPLSLSISAWENTVLLFRLWKSIYFRRSLLLSDFVKKKLTTLRKREKIHEEFKLKECKQICVIYNCISKMRPWLCQCNKKKLLISY